MKLNDSLLNKFEHRAFQITRRYDALANSPDATPGDMQAFLELAYEKSNADFAYKESVRARHIQFKAVIDGMQ